MSVLGALWGLIPTELWVALGGLLSAAVALLVGRQQGKKQEQVAGRLRQAKEDADARNRMDAAMHTGGGADAARERLRDRKAKR